MIKSELIKVMSNYLPRGIVKAGELALPPADALHLAADLAALGIVIMGLDGWYFYDKATNWIAQDITVDLSIEDEVLKAKDAAQQSAVIVKQFIQNCLSPRTAFVSFTLNVPLEWDLFPNLPQKSA